MSEWAKKLEEQKAWVLHAELGIVAQVVKVYAENEYISPTNDEPVSREVIELHNGNALLANEECFVPLSENEVHFFTLSQQALTNFLRSMTVSGARMGIKPPTVAILMLSILREQMMTLQAGHQHLVRDAAIEMRHNESDARPDGDAEPERRT